VALASLAGAIIWPAGVDAAAAAHVAVHGRHLLQVPWRDAGPGWSVAGYSAASLSGSVQGRTRFYLVSPAGRKYQFYVTSPAAYPSVDLIDWSGDRHRILVRLVGAGNRFRLRYEQISLVTGTVVNRFSLPSNVDPLEYTRPRGSSFLADGFGSRAGLSQYSLTGHLQRKFTDNNKIVEGGLEAPDGSFLVGDTLTGLDQISSTGHLIRRIRIPAHVEFCVADRWWNHNTLLANCPGRSPFNTDRPWLVPLHGGSPMPLTPALPNHGLFTGYVGAWRLPSGLYLLADNDRDTLSIVRQSPDGTRHAIHIPGAAGNSDYILTTLGPRLLLQSAIGPGGPSDLFWYNPATRAIRFLFRTPPGKYGVAGVVPYGYRLPR